MWWYNIFGENKESISHILGFFPITAGYILLTIKLVALKRENYEPILRLKINEWRKFIDYFALIIESDPSRVGEKKIHFFHIGSIPSTSSVKLRTSRHHLDKYFNL